MKKRLVSLFLIVVLMIATSLSVMAKGNNSTDVEVEKVLFEAKEITDINELQNRMKNNIKDDENIKLELKTEDNFIRDVKDTNQKLKSVKLKNGNILDSYVYTAIVTVYDEEYLSQVSPLALTPTPDSKADYGDDGGASISYQIRIYYNWIGNPYIPDMERYYDPVSCKTTILSASDEDQISLTSMKAIIAASGRAYYYNGSSLQELGPQSTYNYAILPNPNDTYRNNVSAYDSTVNIYWDSEQPMMELYGAIEVSYLRIPTGQTYSFYDRYLMVYSQ